MNNTQFLHLARQLAEVHVQDSDVLGEISRELIAIIDAEHEKLTADTKRMDYLEQQNPGRFDDLSGPDAFAVLFRLVEPARNTLREAVDAAIAADEHDRVGSG